MARQSTPVVTVLTALIVTMASFLRTAEGAYDEDIDVSTNGTFPCDRLRNRTEYQLLVADNVTRIDFVGCYYYEVDIDISPSPNATGVLYVNILRVSFTRGNFLFRPHGSLGGNISNVHVTVTDSMFCQVYRAIYLRTAGGTASNIVMVAEGRTTIDAFYYALSVDASRAHNVTLAAGAVVSIKADGWSSWSLHCALSVVCSRADGVNIYVGDRAHVVSKSAQVSAAASVDVAVVGRNINIEVSENAVVTALGSDRTDSKYIAAASIINANRQKQCLLENIIISGRDNAVVEALADTLPAMAVAAFGIVGTFERIANVTLMGRGAVRATVDGISRARCAAAVFGIAFDKAGAYTATEVPTSITVAEVNILIDATQTVTCRANGTVVGMFGVAMDLQTVAYVNTNNVTIQNVHAQLMGSTGVVEATASTRYGIGTKGILGVALGPRGHVDVLVENVTFLSTVQLFDVKAFTGFVSDRMIIQYPGDILAIGGFAARDRFIINTQKSEHPTEPSTVVLRNVNVAFSGQGSTTSILIHSVVESAIAIGGITALWTRWRQNATADVTVVSDNSSFAVGAGSGVVVNATTFVRQKNHRYPLQQPSAIALLGVAAHVSSSLYGINGVGQLRASLVDTKFVVAGTVIGSVTPPAHGARAFLGAAASASGDNSKFLNATLRTPGLKLGLLPGAQFVLNTSTGPSAALAFGGVAAATNATGNSSQLFVDWSDTQVELFGDLEVSALVNRTTSATQSALALAGMAAAPSSGANVTVIGSGRKLIVCGSDIHLAGTPSSAFMTRTTVPATSGGPDVFRTTNCPAATIHTSTPSGLSHPIVPSPQPPIPTITSRAVYRDANDACSGPFSDIAGPIVWTETHTTTPARAPTESNSRSLTEVPTLSRSLTRSHSNVGTETNTVSKSTGGTVSFSVTRSPSRPTTVSSTMLMSTSLMMSSTVSTGARKRSLTRTPAVTLTLNRSLTFTPASSATASPSVSHARETPTVTVAVERRGAALEGEDGADGGSVGVVAVAALLGLALCAVLLFLVAWRRRKAEADAKEAAFVEVEQQELQTGPLLGTHSVFVDAARQEELLHVRAGRDEVIAAAETIDSDDDDFMSLRPTSTAPHVGGQLVNYETASIDSLSDVDSDML